MRLRSLKSQGLAGGSSELVDQKAFATHNPFAAG
jgi:hypothetical protein